MHFNVWANVFSIPSGENIAGNSREMDENQVDNATCTNECDADNTESRELTEVRRVLGHAKLDPAELKPLVQSLSFTDELNNDAIVLLETDQGILDHLEAGHRLAVRGDPSDSAVLCTGDRTYEIRGAETSNSLLMLPKISLPQDLPDSGELTLEHRPVCALKYAYFELRKIRPKMERLKELLSENYFNGREYEKDDEHQGHKFTFEELQERIQASDKELRTALPQLHACEINGYWRMLDFDFVDRVLGSILSLVDEQSWSMDCIPANMCADILEDLYPRSVILHVLQAYSEVVTPIKETMETEVADATDFQYKLVEDKVCRHYAEVILKGVVKFALKEFESLWQQSVPDGMKTGLYQLEGLALVVDDSQSSSYIQHFPVSELPEDIVNRFNELFKTKAKWTLDEISPYIEDIAGGKAGVGALLMKNARGSTQNGIKVYSTKRPLIL